MTTSTYDRVLQDARQLPADEQRRLLAELEAGLARPPEQDEDRSTQARAFLAQVDALAHEISARWQGSPSAVEAVREQRREL